MFCTKRIKDLEYMVKSAKSDTEYLERRIASLEHRLIATAYEADARLLAKIEQLEAKLERFIDFLDIEEVTQPTTVFKDRE